MTEPVDRDALSYIIAESIAHTLARSPAEAGDSIANLAADRVLAALEGHAVIDGQVVPEQERYQAGWAAAMTHLLEVAERIRAESVARRDAGVSR
jgi:hypothetical protein